MEADQDCKGCRRYGYTELTKSRVRLKIKRIRYICNADLVGFKISIIK